MCRNETMMRMSAIEGKLLEMIELEAAKGLEAVSAEEMGAAVDMIRDMAEAKYYCSVVLAMQEEEPMGYTPRRYADGRFAPMGYEEPYAPMGMGYESGFQGGSRGGYGYQGGSGGNTASQGGRGGSNGERSGYGDAYGRYQSARMGYQAKATAENRRMMEQTADEHMREFEDSLREIWDEADQIQRNKIKGALVSMANGLK